MQCVLLRECSVLSCFLQRSLLRSSITATTVVFLLSGGYVQSGNTGKIYLRRLDWSDLPGPPRMAGKIWRTDLDGMNLEDVASVVNNLRAGDMGSVGT